MTENKKVYFPAEWHSQSAVQLTWPHKDTDWSPILDEVVPCFVSIAKEIVKRERLIIVCPERNKVIRELGDNIDYTRIIFREMETNDTWARDHAGISVFHGDEPVVLDFVFNGWGMKFAACKDNQITGKMFGTHVFAEEVRLERRNPFVLEGGSIESDGNGTLLTTSECLLSKNRNEHLSAKEIESYLKTTLGAEHILWLHHGYLAGDDTDSHVDTLARFCDAETIAYVRCDDPGDEHYEELKEMESELRSFVRPDGSPYRLIALPMADRVECDGERLPATYANFLIINEAILLPFYGTNKDQVAKASLEKAFPGREVVGVNCSPLIKQHGSLHCVTMQYPEGFVNEETTK